MLAENKVPTTDGAASTREEVFLTWLSRWLFLETTKTTASCEVPLAKKVSSQPVTSHEMRDFEKNDEEHLITAGDGFTFMVCLND